MPLGLSRGHSGTPDRREIDPDSLNLYDEVQYDGDIYELVEFTNDDIVCLSCCGHREWVSSENIVHDIKLNRLVVRGRVF